MMNEQKNDPAAQTMKILVPLGALGAVVAGCGGGGGGMSAALPHQQNGAAANASPSSVSGPTTTALLTIAIPARGAQSSAVKRKPAYISQASAAIGVSIGVTGGPSPVPTYFALPTPGPSPTSTTLPVIAPLGNDTASVVIYDAMPSATSSPNVLSRGTTTATIATGSTALAVQALGVANGIVLSNGTSKTMEVFENDPLAQTAAISAQPVDADGYAITGALASPVPLVASSGLTVSPASVTAPGTVTASWAAGESALTGSLSGGLPFDTAAGSQDNISVAATQYLFVASIGSTDELTVIDPVSGKIVATVPFTASTSASTINSQGEQPEPTGFALAAVAGCGTGETAVIGTNVTSGGSTTAITLGTPAAGASPSAVTLTGTIAPRVPTTDFYQSAQYLAADSACGIYSAGDATLTRYSGFGATVTSAPVGATGWTANSSIGVVGTTIYGTTASGGASVNETLGLQSVPATGGAATSLVTAFYQCEGYCGERAMLVAGTTVYEILTSCNSAYLGYSVDRPSYPYLNPQMQPAATVALAPNGTIYFMKSTTPCSAGATSISSSCGGSITTEPTSSNGNTYAAVDVPGAFGATSADGRYLVAGSSTNPASVQIYAIPATVGAAPVPVGSPLPIGGAISAMAFPH